MPILHAVSCILFCGFGSFCGFGFLPRAVVQGRPRVRGLGRGLGLGRRCRRTAAAGGNHTARRAQLRELVLRVERAVRVPLDAPAVLARVQVVALVRRHALLGLGVHVLPRPALAARQLAHHRRAPLALLVLAPLVARRLLVKVEPLARLLHLALDELALDLARAADAHVLRVVVHLGRLALQLAVLVRLGLRRLARGPLLWGLGGAHGGKVGLVQVAPVRVLVRDDDPLALGRLARPDALVHGQRGGAAVAGEQLLLVRPQQLVLERAGRHELLVL